MKKLRSPLVTTLAASLVFATAAGVSAQKVPAPSYTFERYVIGDDDTRPGGVAQLSTGELAVPGIGFETQTLNVWSSADGGATWSSTPIDDLLTEIVAFGDRFIAVGEASPFDDEARSGVRMASRIWSSTDGLTWDHIATLDDANIYSLTVTPDGLVALGADHRAEEGSAVLFPPGYPTLWTSQDGIDWTANEISAPLPVSTPEPGDDLWAYFMQGPVRSADGVWLAGVNYQDTTSGADKAIVWRSPDGVRWDVVFSPQGEAEISVLAGTPTGFMVTVAGEDGVEILTSTDGIEWASSAEPEDFELHVEAYTSDSAGLIAFEAPMDPGAFEDVFPVQVPMYRFSEDTGWEAVESGIVNGWVGEATVTPDGRLLLAGSDLNDCELSSCVFEPGGDKAAIWIGTPE